MDVYRMYTRAMTPRADRAGVQAGEQPDTSRRREAAAGRTTTRGRNAATPNRKRTTTAAAPARTQATVRVQPDTRDALNAEASASGLSVDAVVRKALAAMRRAALESQAAQELAELADDPRDRAELDAAQADLRGYA